MAAACKQEPKTNIDSVSNVSEKSEVVSVKVLAKGVTDSKCEKTGVSNKQTGVDSKSDGSVILLWGIYLASPAQIKAVEYSRIPGCKLVLIGPVNTGKYSICRYILNQWDVHPSDTVWISGAHVPVPLSRLESLQAMMLEERSRPIEALILPCYQPEYSDRTDTLTLDNCLAGHLSNDLIQVRRRWKQPKIMKPINPFEIPNLRVILTINSSSHTLFDFQPNLAKNIHFIHFTALN